MNVKDIIATIPKEVSQQNEELNLQQILQNIPEEGYDCNKLYYKKIPLGRAKDISNKKINMLIPVFKVQIKEQKGKNAYWLCKCDCGNLVIRNYRNLSENKYFHSCGCKQRQNGVPEYNLIGKRFNRLLVLRLNKLYKIENNLKDGVKYWDCLCDCGNITTVTTRNLISGITKSCGCLRKNIQYSKIKDLTGQTIGRLFVIGLDSEAMKKRTHGETRAIWKCQCYCGKIVSISAANLINGYTFSCGCIKARSSGEDIIYDILLKNNFNFLFDSYYFKDLILNNNNLKRKTLGRYDFIIFNKEEKPIRIIEYDGELHFIQTGIKGHSLEQRKKYDQIKNDYAKQHNIPLVRIPYWEKKNITLDMLMGDKYLIN